MSEEIERVPKRFSSRKMLVVAVVAVMVAASGAAIALSVYSARPALEIRSVSVDLEEAYVGQLTVWTVEVDVPDHGQQDNGLLFTWDWGDGSYTVYDLEWLESNTTATDVEAHAWSQPGLYEVVISVWDRCGSEQNPLQNVSETTPYTVNPAAANTPPVAVFDVEPEEGTTETIFTFDANASWDLEDDTEVLKVRWDWETDGAWDTPYLTVKTTTHQFPDADTYVVTLDVIDSGGMTGSASQEVTVSPSPVYVPHDPILIIGDDDFTSENGVIGGSGTFQNPYVIGGWEIRPAVDDGITVLGTTVYFTICDTKIAGDIENCTYGISLESVDHAVLRDLDVSGFRTGVQARNTDDLTVSHCRLTWNSWGLFTFLCGSVFVTHSEIAHNIVGTGNHDGLAVYETDYLFMAWNTVIDNWDGVFASLVTNADIFNNTFTDNVVGIQALYSGLTIFGNSFTSRHIGILLFDCPDTNVEVNTVIMNPSAYDSHFGIDFMSCANLTVSCNVIRSCVHGIGTEIGNQAYPDSENVIISWNEISNCSQGLSIREVWKLTVTGNRLISNDVGMYVNSSTWGLRAHHNDFVGNAEQAVEDRMGTTNLWDDGYPSGGNFWSDYNGADEYGGADQDEPGPDGIGDTPYVLASGSQDNYPLMDPVSGPSHSAPTADFTVDITVGSVGTVFKYDASSSWDPEDSLDDLRVRWDWESDGTWDTDLSYDKIAEHAYGAPGTYTVAVEVVDSDGLAGTASRDVRVLESTMQAPHAPIVIASNSEFTDENGVVGGSGSPDDPYIISGWRITSQDGECILVTNTTACFVIHNVDLQSDEFGIYAIHLVDVQGGTVVDSEMSGEGDGLLMEYCSYIDVVDCDFSEGIYGVSVYHSTQFYLRGCDFADLYQSFDGHSSSVFTVSTCLLEAKYYPCWLDFCGKGSFTDNHIECTEKARSGAYLLDSSEMTFEGNEFVDCSIDIVGWTESAFTTHSISQDNTVDGRPILHYQGCSDLVLDGTEAGEVIIVDCENVAITNMEFTNGFAGVILAYSSGVLVEDSVFTSCEIGVRTVECNDVVLRGNSVDEALQQAVGIWRTEGAVVEDNYMSCGGLLRYQTLVPVYHSSDVMIVNNTLSDIWSGIRVFSTSRVDISCNHVSGMMAEGVSVGYSSQVEIKGNELTGNGVGLSLERCSETSVYHNNFLGNDAQASDVNGTANAWDSGYPYGGNYWSDYSGVDEDGDGFGDTPYIVDDEAQDNYPLMVPYVPGMLNTPPVADFTVDPSTGPAGTSFDFDASSSEDHEDGTDDLEVRWDWESDGDWDTPWTTGKNETHTYFEDGNYVVTLEVMDSGGLTDQATSTVLVGSSVLLNETFDSWDELDPGWTFWNCSHDDFNNWFDVEDGQLHASNNGVLAYTDYLSYANWTREIVYEGELRLSFDIYIPLAYSDKIGWAGQVFWIMLFDESGSYGLISRFVMDNPYDNPTPNGFVYWDEDGVVQQICTFDSGWHHLEYVLRGDSTIWSLVFDGTAYDGLEYSSPQTGPFNISKLTFVNALREEVQNIYVDNVIVTVGGASEQSPGETAGIAPLLRVEGTLLVGAAAIAVIVLALAGSRRMRTGRSANSKGL